MAVDIHLAGDLALRVPSDTQSTVAVNPSDGVVADGVTSSSVTVTVKDKQGRPLPNAIVTLGVSGDGNVVTQPGVTDSNGVAVGALASMIAETKTITTMANSGTGEVFLADQPTVSFAPGAAAELLFAAQPTSAVIGVAIAPAIQVSVADKFGNVAVGATNAVTMSIANNPGGGMLDGAVTAAAVNGVATFADLRIDKAGPGYALTAASNGLPLATSVAFDINPAMLVFSVEPADVVAGSSFSSPLQVSVKDGKGKLVSGSTAAITISIGNNPGTDMLGGAATVNAAGGVATFTDLLLHKAAASYALTASALNISGATSSSFNVSPGPVSATQSTITAMPSSDLLADGVARSTITITAKDSFGNAISGKTVVLSATGRGNTLVQPNQLTAADGAAVGTLASMSAETKVVSGTVDSIAISKHPSVTFTAPPDMAAPPDLATPPDLSAARDFSTGSD